MHDLLEQTRLCRTAQVRLPTKDARLLGLHQSTLDFAREKN